MSCSASTRPSCSSSMVQGGGRGQSIEREGSETAAVARYQVDSRPRMLGLDKDMLRYSQQWLAEIGGMTSDHSSRARGQESAHGSSAAGGSVRDVAAVLCGRYHALRRARQKFDAKRYLLRDKARHRQDREERRHFHRPREFRCLLLLHNCTAPRTSSLPRYTANRIR